MLRHNMRFFLSSRKDTTTITLRAAQRASGLMVVPTVLTSMQQPAAQPLMPHAGMIMNSMINAATAAATSGHGARGSPAMSGLVPGHGVPRPATVMDLSGADGPQPKRMRLDGSKSGPPTSGAMMGPSLHARFHSDVPVPMPSTSQLTQLTSQGHAQPQAQPPANAPTGAAGTPASNSSVCSPPADAARHVPGLGESPFSLFSVKALPNAAMNTGCLGASLRELVAGDMQLAVVCNYLVDMPFLLSLCPDLARARGLLVVHGEGGHGDGSVIAQMQVSCQLPEERGGGGPQVGTAVR